MPLLACDEAAARAFEGLVDARAAGAQPWQRFSVESARSEPFARAAESLGRAPQTELERQLAEAIERERADRARMIDFATGNKHIRLEY